MSYDKLQQMINESDRIVFFGGAGTSTDCGLPDFRGTKGLYTDGKKEKQYKYPPEHMLHTDFLYQHTAEFFEFYRNEMIFDWAKPNEFHQKLVEMEEKGKLTAIVTQNIDSLHQKAGSRNVIELHGSSARNYCIRCHENYSEDWMVRTTGIPHCEKCGGVVRPEVTLYGEMLNEDAISKAIKHISEADMLIVAGTSLNVYPAAGFIGYFQGKYLVIINKQPTPQDKQADLVINDSVTEVFRELRI